MAFVKMTRYSNIDLKTFHNLAFIVATLVSSINKLDDPDSILHDKVIEAQNLLFSISAIRLAGGLVKSTDGIAYSFINFAIAIKRISRKEFK